MLILKTQACRARPINATVPGEVSPEPEPDTVKDRVGHEPNLPVALALKACPDILPYTQDDIRYRHQSIAVAGFVRGTMGISPDAGTQAQRDMGPEVAAITVVAMMQRISEIQSPGGYLRALTRKAADGAFSPGPMVMALLNTAPKSRQGTRQGS